MIQVFGKLRLLKFDSVVDRFKNLIKPPFKKSFRIKQNYSQTYFYKTGSGSFLTINTRLPFMFSDKYILLKGFLFQKMDMNIKAVDFLRKKLLVDLSKYGYYCDFLEGQAG